MAAARPDEPLTGTATATRAHPARGWVLTLLVLVAVAAAALAAVSLTRLTAATERDQRREQVLDAARRATVNFTTLDYRRLDRDLGRVLTGATGKFRSQFKAGARDLSALVTRNKAVSRGEVLEAGLVSSDDDSARVLVAADSTVTNAASPKPQQRYYRIQLDLVRSGGRWLVSDLQFVG